MSYLKDFSSAIKSIAASVLLLIICSPALGQQMCIPGTAYDCVISGEDLLIVINNFGNTGPADSLLLGDYNADGAVSGGDLLVVTNSFGNTQGALIEPVPNSARNLSVPEPTSAAILAVVAIGGFAVRRWRR